MSSKAVAIKYAQDAWHMLNGVVCIYKTAGRSCDFTRKALMAKLCKDLDEMEGRPPSPFVQIEGNDTSEALKVRVGPSYSDHPLVLGPGFIPKDMRCLWVSVLGKDTSGILVGGLNRGTVMTRRLKDSRLLKTFVVKGKLGFATDTQFISGKVVEKATYDHIKRPILDKLLASIEAIHQRQMFVTLGVDPNSQMAYEIASKGLLRPVINSAPVIYGIKCVSFEPPDFSLEIHCINEKEQYLKTLVHDIGLRLRSCSTCVQLRCVRVGYFTIDHALLNKHWTLEHTINNIAMTDKLIREHGVVPATAFFQNKETLSKSERIGTS